MISKLYQYNWQNIIIKAINGYTINDQYVTQDSVSGGPM